MKKTFKRLNCILLATVLLMTVFPAIPAYPETATTVQLKRTEGSVSVTGNTGRDIGIIDNMKLYNGYHIVTEQKSYAWAELDSSKLAKLDSLSNLELRKKKKDLELLLHSGNIFFNVTEPLEDDETMNIRTSTMIMGIRGTCGWVDAVNGKTTRIYILEGKVECIVRDPVSGEQKQVAVKQGERIEMDVYDRFDGGEDRCEIKFERFEREDVPGFVLYEIAENRSLADAIYAASGVDLRDITKDEVKEKLISDEIEKNDLYQMVQMAAMAQENNVSKDNVWEDDSFYVREILTAQTDEAGISDAPIVPTVDQTVDRSAVTLPAENSDTNNNIKNSSDDDGGSSSENNDKTGGTGGKSKGYTVKFVDEKGIEIPSIEIQTVKSGEKATEPTAPEKLGFIFQYWYDTSGKNGYKYDFNKPVTSNLTLRAIYTPTDVYVITYDARGGQWPDGTTVSTSRINSGNKINSAASAPSREGYTFDAWYKDAQCTARWDFSKDTVTADTTLYAGWIIYSEPPQPAPVTHEVTFDANGGSWDGGSGKQTVKVDDGAKVSRPETPVREGYVFDEWYTDTDHEHEWNFENNAVTADITLYAGWIKALYTVTFDANGGSWDGGSLKQTVKVDDGDKISAPATAPTRERYIFDTWYTDAQYTDEWDFFNDTVTTDITLYAGWIEDIIDSGTCGADLTWKLYQDGTLEISGTGEMDDYTYQTEQPWYNHNEDITDVIIGDNVTSVGEYAFKVCRNLKSVKTPDSLRTISKGAFHSCSGLTSITLSSNLTYIGQYAFCGSKLTSIDIPDSVSIIDDYAFYNSRELANASLPSGLTKINDRAFDSCEKLSSIIIPANVTSIGNSAFSSCHELTSITIPVGLTSIGDGAFSFCLNLEDVYYAGSEGEWNDINIASSGNDYLNNATIHYNSTGPGTGTTSYSMSSISSSQPILSDTSAPDDKKDESSAPKDNDSTDGDSDADKAGDDKSDKDDAAGKDSDDQTGNDGTSDKSGDDKTGNDSTAAKDEDKDKENDNTADEDSGKADDADYNAASDKPDQSSELQEEQSGTTAI